MSERTKWDTVPIAAERSFRRLRNDVIWLHFAWENFLALYGTKESVDLLNRTASTFFVQLQEYYLGGIVLAVTRLLDPAVTKLWTNHSLEVFIELIDLPAHARHAAALRTRLKRMKKLQRPFRTLRDKRFSHTSPDHLEARLPLPRRRVQAMLRALTEFVSAVGWHFERRRIYLPLETPPMSSGGALVWVLRRADEHGILKARETVRLRRRLKKG